MAMISGPWSLWAPSFGERAIDFERMRRQLLAAGDAVLALDDLPREVIAGNYLGYRAARAAGAPTCSQAQEHPPSRPLARTDFGGAARGCLAHRSAIGPRNIGRVRLGFSRRRRLLGLPVTPIRKTRRSYRYCFK